MVHRLLQCLVFGVAVLASVSDSRSNPPNVPEMDATYDFYLGGIRIGDLAVSAAFGTEGYDANSTLRTTGVVGFFYELAMKAKVVGQIGADGLSPESYKAKSRSPKRVETVEISFEGGTPVSSQIKPPRKVKSYSIDPLDQSGTIDPLSALLTAFSPGPIDRICEQRVDVYDGRRRYALEIEAEKRKSDRIFCKGNYVRLAGFKPKWLGKNAKRPFTLFLNERDDGLFEVNRAVIDTEYGPAILQLRK